MGLPAIRRKRVFLRSPMWPLHIVFREHLLTCSFREGDLFYSWPSARLPTLHWRVRGPMIQVLRDAGERSVRRFAENWQCPVLIRNSTPAIAPAWEHAEVAAGRLYATLISGDTQWLTCAAGPDPEQFRWSGRMNDRSAGTYAAKDLLSDYGNVMSPTTLLDALVRAGVMREVEYLSTTGSGELKRFREITPEHVRFGINKKTAHEFRTNPQFYVPTFPELLVIAAEQILADAKNLKLKALGITR